MSTAKIQLVAVYNVEKRVDVNIRECPARFGRSPLDAHRDVRIVHRIFLARSFRF